MPTNLHHPAKLQSALRIRAIVSSDNRLELELPPGSEGQEVEVLVILPNPSNQQTHKKKQTVLEIIENARKRHATRTAEEIDQQIRAERESWDD
ncbi:MAG TPA: hypothetical protein ACFE0H_13795 [Elainellaceae cyanobacterium]|jgi:hypothetical protein